MRFRIDQFVSKIKTPIMYKIDGGELSFAKVEDPVAHFFDKYYLIDSVEIEDGKAVLTLKERMAPGINSVGDKIVPTEVWIKEQKERCYIERNLFDGV